MNVPAETSARRRGPPANIWGRAVWAAGSAGTKIQRQAQARMWSTGTGKVVGAGHKGRGLMGTAGDVALTLSETDQEPAGL